MQVVAKILRSRECSMDILCVPGHPTGVGPITTASFAESLRDFVSSHKLTLMLNLYVAKHQICDLLTPLSNILLI
jgi:hypothetical protein